MSWFKSSILKIAHNSAETAKHSYHAETSIAGESGMENDESVLIKLFFRKIRLKLAVYASWTQPMSILSSLTRITSYGISKRLINATPIDYVDDLVAWICLFLLHAFRKHLASLNCFIPLHTEKKTQKNLQKLYWQSGHQYNLLVFFFYFFFSLCIIVFWCNS